MSFHRSSNGPAVLLLSTSTLFARPPAITSPAFSSSKTCTSAHASCTQSSALARALNIPASIQCKLPGLLPSLHSQRNDLQCPGPDRQAQGLLAWHTETVTAKSQKPAPYLADVEVLVHQPAPQFLCACSRATLHPMMLSCGRHYLAGRAEAQLMDPSGKESMAPATPFKIGCSLSKTLVSCCKTFLPVILICCAFLESVTSSLLQKSAVST